MAIMRDMVKNEDGQEVPIYIEVDAQEVTYDAYEDTDADDELRGPRLPDARDAFKKAMELIHVCAEQVAHTVQKIPEQARPSACEVQLSVKLSGGVAVLVHTSSEAQLQVTLKWGKQDS